MKEVFRSIAIGARRNYLPIVNWHQLIEERSYEMDQVIAEVLRRDPAKLDSVIGWIRQRLDDPNYSVHSKDALQEWLDLINGRGLAGVLETLTDRSEDASYEAQGHRRRKSPPAR